MPNHHFISYSRNEAKDFVLQLCDELETGPPVLRAWIDEREIKPGRDWEEEISEAIKTCETMLFVMTPDSVRANSPCKIEWARALKYKKAVIPLLWHPEAETPFGLSARQHIDFTDNYESALARLRRHLQWLNSPAGLLATLRDRLADAERALPRAETDAARARVEADLQELRRQITEQQWIVEHPEEAARRVEKSIANALKRERQPAQPVSGLTRTKFINPPPGLSPSYFQDRHAETGLIGEFVKNDAQRLLTIVGRGGIGKTAVVCRLLKALESGQLPEDGGPLSVDGIVYLSANGSRRVNLANLFADVCELLPDEPAEKLDTLFRDPQVSTEAKMKALLAAFPEGRVVVLLDNFEDVVNPETHGIADGELAEALPALLKAPHHGLKVILTTRIAPRDLALIEPGRQMRLNLDEGLPSPFAENILRAMDTDGKVGLQSASAALLDTARQRTRGYPRALEALFAILSADRDTSLEELLADTARLLPDNVTRDLVGEAFSRLDPTAQRVMQALAVYARPVPPTAVDYLLQPFLAGVNSAPVLGRLVNMQFARKERGRYYLHPVDLAYALARIDRGNEFDHRIQPAPFTQFALLHRAADYFQETRSPRETWKNLDDLAPQLAEFDLRYAAHDFETAATVLLEIDFDYLHLWGHIRLMAGLHERLQGKLDDRDLEEGCTGNLGTAYYQLGRVGEAISCYERALFLARKAGTRQGEGTWLGSLASCYSDLGQTSRAIDFYEQALAIARDMGDRYNEGACLGSLANQYSNLGQTSRAIDFYRQALAIARDIGNRSSEGLRLGNLAECYSNLGQTSRAIDLCEQALAIARDIGDRSGEGYWLLNLSDIFADEGQHRRAVEYASDAVAISKEIQEPRLGSYSGGSLARAHLLAGQLAAARAAAEAARLCDAPENNFHVSALGGVIALRLGDLSAARQMLAAAVTEAGEMLKANAENYAALDSNALALCGLALGGEAGRAADAIESYRAARKITRDPGVVKRVLLLFDALAVLDTGGALTGVRAAAGGET